MKEKQTGSDQCFDNKEISDNCFSWDFRIMPGLQQGAFFYLQILDGVYATNFAAMDG